MPAPDLIVLGRSATDPAADPPRSAYAKVNAFAAELARLGEQAIALSAVADALTLAAASLRADTARVAVLAIGTTADTVAPGNVLTARVITETVTGRSGTVVDLLGGKVTGGDLSAAIAALTDGAPPDSDTLGKLALRIGAVRAGLDAIVGGTPAELDTFIEVYNRFLSDETALTALTGTVATKLDRSAVSSYGLTLIDDVDAATARTTLGLGQVDNTSDAQKPVSTAQATALAGKAATGDNADIAGLIGPNGGGIYFRASGATLASAATVDLGAAKARRVTITGTTAITSFGTTLTAEVLLRFTGSLTLTHNATSLILPGGVNLVTAAGDTAIVTSDGSGNWTLRHYQRAAYAPGDAGALTAGALPDGRLSGVYAGAGLRRTSANPLLSTTSAASQTDRVADGTLVAYRNAATSVTGAIVFLAPPNITNVNHALQIVGYNYAAANTVSCEVSGFRGLNAWFNTGLAHRGNLRPTVRWGRKAVINADGTVASYQNALIVGDVTTVWSSPHIAIVRGLMSGFGATDAYATGWAADIVTDLPAPVPGSGVAGYDLIAAPVDDAIWSSTNAAGSAAAVTGGTSFTQKLPSGLILQGAITSVSLDASGSATITLPTALVTNNCVPVVTSAEGATSGVAPVVSATSKTNFTVKFAGLTSGTFKVNWIAYGY